MALLPVGISESDARLVMVDEAGDSTELATPVGKKPVRKLPIFGPRKALVVPTCGEKALTSEGASCLDRRVTKVRSLLHSSTTFPVAVPFDTFRQDETHQF